MEKKGENHKQGQEFMNLSSDPDLEGQTIKLRENDSQARTSSMTNEPTAAN